MTTDSTTAELNLETLTELVLSAPKTAAFLKQAEARAIGFPELLAFTAALEGEIHRYIELVQASREAAWEDRDLPEEPQIMAAHPLASGDYASHADAMRMVGAKHSKHAIVDLVNWLLVRAVQAERTTRAFHAQLRLIDDLRARLEGDVQRLDGEAERWSARYMRKCSEVSTMADVLMPLAEEVGTLLEGFEPPDAPGWLAMRHEALTHLSKKVSAMTWAKQKVEPTAAGMTAALKELETLVLDPHAQKIIAAALGSREEGAEVGHGG